jgi:transcription initiation factor TFIIE subunit beta
MDAALIAERRAFQQKAMAVPVLENKRVKREEPSSSKKPSYSAKKPPKPPSATEKLDLSRLKNMGTTSQFKFSVLARIVRHMKNRHMEGEDHPLTLEEILDETSQLDVGSKTRQWLQMEALNNNPKIKVCDDGNSYMFKPPFELRNKKSLLNLLKRRDLNGDGGVYRDDINESLAKAEKVIQNLIYDSKIIEIPRPCDKKKVLFYHDHTTDFEVDDEFKKQWRSVSVDGIDDNKIEEYLSKQGITSMQDQGFKKFVAPKRKKGGGNRKRKAPKDNEHLLDVLEDYSEDSTKNK